MSVLIVTDREALGEALSRTRLASTALDLGDPVEAQAILAALCGYLVERAAVDPLEGADECPYCLGGLVTVVASFGNPVDFKKATQEELDQARADGSYLIAWCPDCGGTGRLR